MRKPVDLAVWRPSASFGGGLDVAPRGSAERNSSRPVRAPILTGRFTWGRRRPGDHPRPLGDRGPVFNAEAARRQSPTQHAHLVGRDAEHLVAPARRARPDGNLACFIRKVEAVGGRPSPARQHGRAAPIDTGARRWLTRFEADDMGGRRRTAASGLGLVAVSDAARRHCRVAAGHNDRAAAGRHRLGDLDHRGQCFGTRTSIQLGGRRAPSRRRLGDHRGRRPSPTNRTVPTASCRGAAVPAKRRAVGPLERQHHPPSI